MNKPLFIVILLSNLIFSATPEQVEQYISVSNSEEQLIALEGQFSKMQNNLNRLESNTSEASENYDMQLLSIRFREYLQKNISEDEMNEILKQYKSILLLQFVSAQNDPDFDPKVAANYVKELQKNPEASVRIELAEKIANALYKKESVTILFDNLIKPLMRNSIGGNKINDEIMKKSRDSYIKMMSEQGKTETIYLTKDFTQDELEALLKIVQTPAIDHESKAVFGAMAYALKEFFLSMASRYDVSKHQR
ncbi:hypothetical protein MNB_SV-8-869 [hydrothermal vent metagenome]|uniref:Uncharacterized protein n=1 Tax=hydrothermal vent metagenome TaxID=652676 RepID=A0A1W1BF35_9ZZZZ